MCDTPLEIRFDSALGLVRLFAQARLALEKARLAARDGDGDPEPALAVMRCRLIDTVWNDCTMFDEATIYALAQFVGVWRAAAADLAADKEREFDDALEKAHAAVFASLGKCLGPRSADLGPVSAAS